MVKPLDPPIMSPGMRDDSVRKVVVLGRDEALWITAHVLWQTFRHAGIQITLVELPSLLRRGDVIPTLKAQEAYHALMGLEEAPLMRASQATFSLGQRFSNWSKTRPPFIHGYSTYGVAINRVPFVHYWVKARAMGLKAEFEDFSINAAAAKQGRFFIPGDATDGFAICDYAYHLGAVGYCQLLKLLAQHRKIEHIASGLAEAVLSSEDGRITHLKLVDGQDIEGDFFIDASGPESLLLGKALGVGFDSWRKWFPCDRLLSAYAPPLSPLPSFSQVSAHRAGWLGLYPLQDGTAMQQVYASVDLSDQEAYETAGIMASMKMNADAVVMPFEAGVRKAFWSKNCVAIGEAAAVLDPIDSVRMHGHLVGLSHLIALFPIERAFMPESEEYNHNVLSTLERLRDYQLAHYKLNQRFDQPLWDHCRNLSLPDHLAYKLDQFAARGNLVVYDDETFTDDDWTSLMIGHGLIPRAYDPVADQTSDAEVIHRFQNMLGFIKMNVDPMKPMEAYLGQAVSGLA